MFHFEVLVFEFVAVYAETARPVRVEEVAALTHEVSDHSGW